MPVGTGAASSLDGSRRASEARPEAYLAKNEVDRVREQLPGALAAARRTQCQSQINIAHAFSSTSQKAYEIPCGSWGCKWCSWRKSRAVKRVVEGGIFEAAKRGERVRFITLTEDPKKPLDLRSLYKTWDRLRAALRALDLLDEYAMVVETTERGRLHAHILATGSYIDQRRLSRLAEQAGFGRVSDIRAVRLNGSADDKRTASYISKEISGYVTKAKVSELGERSKTAAKKRRRRPLRTSRGWWPGGLTRAEKELRAESLDPENDDAGPWWIALGDPKKDGGSVKVFGADSSGQKWKLTLSPNDLQQDEVERLRSEEDAASLRQLEKRHLRSLESPTEVEDASEWREAA